MHSSHILAYPFPVYGNSLKKNIRGFTAGMCVCVGMPAKNLSSLSMACRHEQALGLSGPDCTVRWRVALRVAWAHVAPWPVPLPSHHSTSNWRRRKDYPLSISHSPKGSTLALGESQAGHWWWRGLQQLVLSMPHPHRSPGRQVTQCWYTAPGGLVSLLSVNPAAWTKKGSLHDCVCNVRVGLG